MHKFGPAFGLHSHLSEFLWKPALWFESANENSLVGEHSVRFQSSLDLCLYRGCESLSLGSRWAAREKCFWGLPE